MRRAALIAFALVVLAGTLVLALDGARDRRTLAFTAGVPAQAPLVVLAPGATVCQGPLPVAAAFAAVELQVGTFGRPGEPLTLVVRDAFSEQPVAQGRLAAGYDDVARPRIDVGRVPQGGRVAVCVRNDGRRRVALYGAADAASHVSTATLDGRPANADVDLVFRRAAPTGTLALIPDMLQRMALFKGGWVGAWLFWLLLVAAVLGVPLLLARALASAVASGDQTTPR